MDLPAVSSPLQVVIVEDHPQFRDALHQCLAGMPGVQVQAVCKDLPAGLNHLEHTCPQLLLVDLGLPSGSGMGLIRQAHTRWGERCTSAVLTVTGNEEHLMTAVAAGAKGYVFKSDQPEQWRQTVQMLAQGQSPLNAKLARSFLQSGVSGALAGAERGVPEEGAAPPEFDLQTQALLLHVAAGYTTAEAATRLNLHSDQAGRCIRSVYDRFVQPGPNLSPRELELLQLLNKGYPFRKCAELMGVGEATTKTQAARAYQKLGASNLQTALYEARVAGLLS
jgi:DNA-binding NarL/FixJ family response regulator